MTASTSIPAAAPVPLATVRSPLPPPARLSGIPLRPYQQDALAAIERAAARGLRRLLLALPTGAGKTVVVGHLIHRRGGRAVVLAHRDELLEQARDKLCAIDPAAADRVAILRGGSSNATLRAPILVASVQTLARPERLAALPHGIGTVVVDEAHHATAATYMRILRTLGAFDPDPRRAPLVVGITATPERGDGEGLGEVFQRLVYRKAIADLIMARYLAGVRAVQVSIEADFADLPLNLAGDFAEGDLERVLLDAQAPAHAVAAFLQHGADRRRALLFAPTVRVAHAMAEAFRAAGVPAEALDGNTPERERVAMLGRLRAGTTRLLANVNVLCLDAETEILTDQGWVGPDQITFGHRVANWSPEGVFFESPREIVIRPRAPGERMVALETRSRSIRVTEGHRMLYRTTARGPFHKAAARDLVGRECALPVSGRAEPFQVCPEQPLAPDARRTRRLLSVAAYNLRKREGFDEPGSRREARRRFEHRYGLRHKNPSELTETECAFIGFWLGDGSVTHLASGGLEYKLVQSTTYPTIVEWVDSLVGSLGMNVVKRLVPGRPGVAPAWCWSFPRGTGFGSQERRGLFAIEPYLKKRAVRCSGG